MGVDLAGRGGSGRGEGRTGIGYSYAARAVVILYIGGLLILYQIR